MIFNENRMLKAQFSKSRGSRIFKTTEHKKRKAFRAFRRKKDA